ncbi:MAG: protein kinase [Myxococcaceae bacterium]|nr:protein kinase [Myxococcaceae bacterium]
MSKKPSFSSEHTVVLLASPGTVLDGRWRIEQRIGQGAMGSVFRGTDLRTQRPVAIKILAPEHCRKPKVLARFEREAKLMTTLRHPNLVRFYGVGRRGALPFIVMQFLEGLSLSEVLVAKGGRLAPAEMLAIVRQVAAGLSFVHHHGLVHRDIKPQNVMVSTDRRVTLLDFGVVRDKSSPGLTNPGALVGTPYYMAPEQISSKGEVDKRADVYALGALAFELLVGKPPFSASSSHEVLRAHRHTPAPDAAALVPGLGHALGTALQRAMAKKPADRPQGALELYADLSTAEKMKDVVWDKAFPIAMWMQQAGKTVPLQMGTDEQTHGVESSDEIPLLPSGEVHPVRWGAEEASLSNQETDDGHPLLGELRVVTTVNGVTQPAELFVNGEHYGHTPKSLPLKTGAHRMKVVREGCVIVERAIAVDADQVTLVRLELKPSA